MSRPSLVGQLLRIHVGVVVVTCVFLVGAALAGAAGLLRGNQDTTLSQLAGSMCHDIMTEVTEHDAGVVAAADEAFHEADLPGHDLELVGLDGGVLARVGRRAAARSEGFRVGCRSAGAAGASDVWRECSRRCDGVVGVRVRAADVLAAPLTRLSAAGLLLALPFALGIGSLAGWRLVRRRLQPLAELRDAAATLEPNATLRLGIDAAPSELADLEAAFDGVLERLEAALDRERRFSQQASHELRTPLTVARGRLERLAERLEPTTEAARDARAALDEVAALDRLVDELLVLSRSESLPLAGVPVNLCDVAREALHRFAAAGDAGTGPVELVGPDEILVTAGEGLLERVLENLLENARRHGGARARIRLSLESCDGFGVVRVEDDGPGMSDELRPRVFERFVRGARSGSVPGAGLGLAVVQTVAHRYGGAVRARRSELGGEEIRVALPLHDGGAGRSED